MKKTVIGFAKSPMLAPCKESKSGIPEIFVLVVESGILEIIWDPGFWNPEYSARNPECH